jgi:hypothetical protein
MADVSSDAQMIQKYAMDLGMKTSPAVGKAMEPIGQVGELTTRSFMIPNAESGSFGEAAIIAETLQRGASDFTGFLKDLQTGIIAMTDAAIVVSDVYGTTDSTNGNDINIVDFAFADPGAQRPQGLSKDLVGGQSLQDYMAQQQANQPQSQTMDVNAPGVTMSHEPGSDETVYTFPDGSTKTVSSVLVPGPNGVPTVQQTTSYADKNGKELPDSGFSVNTEYGKTYTTTTRTETSSETDPVTNKTTTRTTSTVTTENKDGSTEVKVLVDGKVQSDTKVAAPSTSSNNSASGDPLKQAEQDYDNYGDEWDGAAGDQYKKPVYGH